MLRILEIICFITCVYTILRSDSFLILILNHSFLKHLRFEETKRKKRIESTFTSSILLIRQYTRSIYLNLDLIRLIYRVAITGKAWYLNLQRETISNFLDANNQRGLILLPPFPPHHRESKKDRRVRAESCAAPLNPSKPERLLTQVFDDVRLLLLPGLFIVLLKLTSARITILPWGMVSSGTRLHFYN